MEGFCHSKILRLSLEGTGPIFQQALQNLVDAHVAELVAFNPKELQGKGAAFPSQSSFCSPAQKNDFRRFLHNAADGITLPVPLPARPTVPDDDAVTPKSSISDGYQTCQSVQFVESKPKCNVLGDASTPYTTFQVLELPTSRQGSKSTNCNSSTNGSGDAAVEKTHSRPSSWQSSRTRSILKAHLTGLDGVDEDAQDVPKRSRSFGDVFRGTPVKGRNRLEKIVNHPVFETTFAMLILLNTVTIAVEKEYDGIDVGHKLGVDQYPQKANDLFPNMKDVIDAAYLLFGVLFTSEVLLKIVGLRCRFFKSGWNLFDLTIVTGWILSEFANVSVIANPMMFRVMRLLRLIRITRLVKSIQAMDALQILVTSIRTSFSILVWASVILSVLITLVSIFISDQVSSFLNDPMKSAKAKTDVFMYFGTFSRCAFSMFEATVGNFAVPMRILMNNLNSSWGFFFMAYKISGGFAVVSVIMGVFLHETFRVANSDDNLMIIKQHRQTMQHIEKMTRLFRVADTKGQGTISFETFKEIVSDPYIKTWLAAYELSVVDVKHLFELIDDGDGELTAAELVTGVGRLKGNARSVDLHTMMYETMRLLDEVKDLVEQS